MADLKDIGNGFKVVDFSNQGEGIVKQLQIADLVNKLGNAPAETALTKAKLANEQVDLAKKQTGIAQDAFMAAATGNLSLANRVYQENVNPYGTLFPHPDPEKKNRGYFIEKDSLTGKEQEINSFAKLGIENRINTETEVLKDAMLRANRRPEENAKWAREKANEAWQAGIFDTYNEALSTYNAAITQSNKFQGLSTPEINNKLLSSATVRNAANIGSQDLLNVSGAKKTQLSEKDIDEFTGLRNSSVMLKTIGDTLVSAKDKFLPGIGLTNATLQDLRSKININAPEYTAIKALTEEGLFQRLKQDSGVSFRPEEEASMRQRMPTGADTLQNAVIKIAVVQSMIQAKAQSRLGTLEAANRSTGKMRELFQGKGYDLTPDKATAQGIVNTLPSTFTKDKEVLGYFLKGLSPSVAGEVSKELVRTGVVHEDALGTIFRNALKENK